MNKKTAIMTGVFTMAGIVFAIGFIASRDISAKTVEGGSSGMIKKPVNVMPVGRTEYRIDDALAELERVETAFTETIDDLKNPEGRLSNSINHLQALLENIGTTIREMYIRHGDRANDVKYQQKKQVIDALKAEATDLINKRLAELNK